MKSFKKHAIAVAGIGIAFLIAAAICYIVGSTNEISTLGGIALILIIVGVILLIVGIAKFFQSKKIDGNLADINSLAHKTYGAGKEYSKFFAYINKKAQRAKNAAVNTLGVLSMVVGGVGVFQSGTNHFDVFVSDEEIILNSPQTNPNYDDRKFEVIKASEIKSIEFETKKAYEFVTIVSKINEKPLTLEILIKGTSSEAIRNAFNKLTTKEEQISQ